MHKALEITVLLESAIKHSSDIQNSNTKGSGKNAPVYKLDDSKKVLVFAVLGIILWRQAGLLIKCFHCKSKGHTVKVCRKKARADSKINSQPNQTNLVKGNILWSTMKICAIYQWMNCYQLLNRLI